MMPNAGGGSETNREGIGSAVRLGSAGRVSPSTRLPQAWRSDLEGCAVGAPNVPDRGGVLEEGACPLLHEAA